MSTKVNWWRPIAFMMGVSAGSVGCWGAYEWALKLEHGTISYLVVAAPLIAIGGTIIPPLAEHLWKKGEIMKSTMWWLAMAPVLAVLFFSAAERVHQIKAVDSAEIIARQKAANRAELDLINAQAKLAIVEVSEIRAKAIVNAGKICNMTCSQDLLAAEATRAEVVNLQEKLEKKQGLATTESELKAPDWLIPVGMDIIAFLAVWTSLSAPWTTIVLTPKDRRWARNAREADQIPVETNAQAFANHVNQIGNPVTSLVKRVV